MNIYVAGTVLRDTLDQQVWVKLNDIYHKIDVESSNQGHHAQLPYVDHALDALPAHLYHEEIDRRIRAADSIITVLSPPNPAVAAEALTAAQLNKPQAILRAPAELHTPLPRSLAHVPVYSTQEPSFAPLMKELSTQVAAAKRQRHGEDNQQYETA